MFFLALTPLFVRFSEFAERLSDLRDASIVEKTAQARDLIGRLQTDAIPLACAILSGEPIGERRRIPPTVVKRALSVASGMSLLDLRKLLRVYGDLPKVSQTAMAHRTQSTFSKVETSVLAVLSRCEELLRDDPPPERMISSVAGIMASLNSAGARLLTQILLGEYSAYVSESELAGVVADRLECSAIEIQHDARTKGWKDTISGVIQKSPGTA